MRGKRSSLFSHFILNEEKSVTLLNPELPPEISGGRDQVTNLQNFFVRNLRIFGISLSVCPRQVFLASSNKHSGLLQNFKVLQKKKVL